MNQEKKKALEPAIKAILKKHGIKGSLRVRNHSTLILTIRESSIDFIGDYNSRLEERNLGREEWNKKMPVTDGNIEVNHYTIDSAFTSRYALILNELQEAMMVGNHDNSDIMTDYFDVGWYAYITIGEWNKPYILIN
jgi:hypothetical protein